MPAMAKKKTKQDRTSQGESVQAYLDANLVAEMRRFMADTKRTLKATLELAVECLLRQEKRWPPRSDGQEGGAS